MKKSLFILLYLLPLFSFSQVKSITAPPVSGSWKVVGTSGFSAGTAVYLSMAISLSGAPLLAFKDYGNAAKSTVMTFDGSQWTSLGAAGFSPGEVWFPSLALDPAGQPYVGFEDAGNSFGATVMTYNGTDWIPVGVPGFTAGTANYISLAVNPAGSNQLCIAFMDGAHGNKASVMMYNGSAWVYLGNPGFSAGEAEYLSLAFSPAGQPFVAFSDEGHNGKITVMKYNGYSWNYAGNGGFSAGAGHHVSLAFNADGEPHVAYWDEILNGVVSKFNGTYWYFLGYPGFSNGEARCISLAFNQEDEAVVAFINVTDHSYPRVSTYKNFNWIPIDAQGLATGNADFSCMSVSQAGTLYIAYQDIAANSCATVKKFDSVYVGVEVRHNLPVKIFPNPATDKINLDFPSLTDTFGELEIFQTEGNNIFSAKRNGNNFSLDIGNFSPGLYFFRLKTDSSNYFGRFLKVDNR